MCARNISKPSRKVGYSDLPEDIYSRNFLRLYAQALGLEDSKLLDQYTRERRSALGISPNEIRRTEVIQGESSPRRNPLDGF